MLPGSYEAQLSEYIQLSHKKCLNNLYWTKGSRGQVRSSVKRALQSPLTPEFLVVGWRFLVHDFDIKYAHNVPGKSLAVYVIVSGTHDISPSLPPCGTLQPVWLTHYNGPVWRAKLGHRKK